jgi:hypothetical protein
MVSVMARPWTEGDRDDHRRLDRRDQQRVRARRLGQPCADRGGAGGGRVDDAVDLGVLRDGHGVVLSSVRRRGTSIASDRQASLLAAHEELAGAAHEKRPTTGEPDGAAKELAGKVGTG